jgi:hypothetical protein
MSLCRCFLIRLKILAYYPIDKFLGEAEFTFDTLNVDNAYDIFNQSYIKSTGKSWDKDKFLWGIEERVGI